MVARGWTRSRHARAHRLPALPQGAAVRDRGPSSTSCGGTCSLNVPGLRRFRPPAVGRWARDRPPLPRPGGRDGRRAHQARPVLLGARRPAAAGGDPRARRPPGRGPARSASRTSSRQIEEDFGRPLAEVFSWVSPEPGGLGLARPGPPRPAALRASRWWSRSCGRGSTSSSRPTSPRPGWRSGCSRCRAASAAGSTSTASPRRSSRPPAASSTSRTRGATPSASPAISRATRGSASPACIWTASARRTLTLENVGYLKIGDLPALERAGISRPEVARTLYRIYMQQIFVHHFVHADPHPGQPVRPAAAPAGTRRRSGRAIRCRRRRTATSGRSRSSSSTSAWWRPSPSGCAARCASTPSGWARATPPAWSIPMSARACSCPGPTCARLEEIHEELFRRFWGVSIGSLRDVAFSEASYFFREYRDLLYQIPFQVQVDLLFASRAVGLLAGHGHLARPGVRSLGRDRARSPSGSPARSCARDWRGLLRTAAHPGAGPARPAAPARTFLIRAERGDADGAGGSGARGRG